MRIATIIGTVTLSRRIEDLRVGRLLIAQPIDENALRGQAESTGETVVVYDELGAGVDTQVAISEGREGAMPFYPDKVPVDAYCAALLDTVVVTDQTDQKKDE